MKIAVSKGSGSEKYLNYGRWIQAASEEVEIVDLNGLSPHAAVEALAGVRGLVLSGGEDVGPERYDRPEQESLCGTINRSRDAMEFAVAQAAIDANMPVLAICRGMQLLNVLYGGTLYADVPSQRQQATNGQLPPGAVEHRKVDGVDGQHHLIVEPGSLIRRITRATEGPINSAHHQAVDQLANMFTASATSDDGLIEALEWGDAALGGKPFLLAVQWHPERMDWDSPFSLPIARHFVQEAAAYHLLFA